MPTHPTSRPTVLVVDDHHELAENIAAWLRAAGFHAITASNGIKALQILRSVVFDVVIADLEMPEMSGLELLAALNATRPDVQVIVLTGHPTVDNAVAALRQGKAFDFLQKPLEDLAQLREAIEAAVRKARGNGAGAGVEIPDHFGLTTREREVLALLLEGLDNSAIADRLFLSEKTVRNHLTQAYRKLGVSTRAQAIVALQQNGTR